MSPGINDLLGHLEKHPHKLSDITNYLVTFKYAKARDHEEEVQDFVDVLDKCSTDIFTVLHNCHAAAQAVANPAQLAQAHPSPKPSTLELYPKKLSHDTTMAIFRTSKTSFGHTMTPLSSVPSHAHNNRLT